MKEEQRLLFINKSKEETDEFTKAMPKGNFEIDVAENGTDAGAFLKQHTYGVVILDMQLDGHDSEKIVKGLNRNYPDTLCIIYTYNLARAQLNFLLNECTVFRIFLSPANFLEEMYPAINEAFAVYGNNRAMKEEDGMERQLSELKRRVQGKKALLLYQQKSKRQLISFLDKIILETVGMTDEQLSPEEKKVFIKCEKELLEQSLDILENPCGSLEEIEERLTEEFGGRKRCRKLNFELPGEEPKGGHRYLYEALYMAIWILLHQYWEFSNKNEAEVKITLEEQKYLGAEIYISRPKNISEEKLRIAESAVNGILETFEKKELKEENYYRMRVKVKEK